MSFPPATEMFQFAGFASPAYGFSRGYRLRGGLPHSEIPGSPIARISPGLVAACHVLHRLSVPRHPPDALTSRFLAPHPTANTIERGNSLSRRNLQSPAAEDTYREPTGQPNRAAHGFPPRSHNLLIHICPSTTRPSCPRSGTLARAKICFMPRIALARLAKVAGGGERGRTDDLLLAKQALSQLSYTPFAKNGGPGRI
jgi:hypothetical protein